ncbi:alpha-ketoglutarate-dependent dioxygenase alkB homolog 4 [Hydra vulgaris]|uniref:Alpha-ketoglutarate-dependent dioxygenase alkB homolog 4 n=1 Tax=Hydra vulgaris TaxID=6087 RepID=A0ABM4CNY0_HYDVU
MEKYKCGCTGIRHCLLCTGIRDSDFIQNSVKDICWLCPECEVVFEGNVNEILLKDNINWCSLHLQHNIFNLHIDKVIIINNFVTETEESYLLTEINKDPWKMSQSGRRKQDFGPKVNFKRKKLKTTVFTGFPGYSKFVVEKMRQVESLRDFFPVELCNLEYSPERGSSIDPHIDDTWLWGEQLVTLNLNSATILTLTSTLFQQEIQIPMMPRSLVIIEKNARYNWMHGIKSSDITDLRVAMTFRNLSQPFVKDSIGQQLLHIAKSFQGTVVS